jgi:hypothetical protein
MAAKTATRPRAEHWARTVGTRTLTAVMDVEPDGSVRITRELLAQLLEDAGWQRVADPT